MFSFGEANTADVLDLTVTGPLEHIFSLTHKYFRIRPCLIRGRGFFQTKFGILPKRHPITTVGECETIGVTETSEFFGEVQKTNRDYENRTKLNFSKSL